MCLEIFTIQIEYKDHLQGSNIALTLQADAAAKVRERKPA
jgi:hypothetical protein